MISAIIAGIGGSASHTVMLPLVAALYAMSNACWPTVLHDIGEANIISTKLKSLLKSAAV